MKCLDKEVFNYVEATAMEEILIVDGYNIIGAWPNLREIKDRGELEEARDSLLNWLI